MNPAEIPLPAFLDPILDYLSSTLPAPLYAFLLSFLSHSLALVTGLIALSKSLASSQPWNWDAQAIIPPLMTVLAAYLALLSLYRTTSWMVRSSLWFAKWGAIFAAFVTGAAWYMGNGGANGVASTLGGVVLDMINGRGQNAAGGQRSRTPPRHKKPSPWDSFKDQEQWKYEEAKRESSDGSPDIQKIIQDIVGEGGWWDTAKDAYNQMASQYAPEPNKKPKASGRKRKNGSR